MCHTRLNIHSKSLLGNQCWDISLLADGSQTFIDVLTLVHWFTQTIQQSLSLSLDTAVDCCSKFHNAMLLETHASPVQLHYWIWSFKECWLNCPSSNAKKANLAPMILHNAMYVTGQHIVRSNMMQVLCYRVVCCCIFLLAVSALFRNYLMAVLLFAHLSFWKVVRLFPQFYCTKKCFAPCFSNSLLTDSL